MSGTLSGLRVVDAASFLAGPCAATIMSDFGADVVKVEPLTGDGHRRLSGSHPIDYTWQLTNRNKRGLALDFTRPEGLEVLLRLIDAADVVIFNLRADQLQRYGLTWEALHARNPRLIVAQLSGYGLLGPEADRRAFDATAWFARTGILDAMAHKDALPPQPAGGAGDHATAMTLFAAIMMALYRRTATGEGSMVSTFLAGTGAWANGLQVLGAMTGDDLTLRRDKEGWMNPFSSGYRTRDGRHLVLALAAAGRDWPVLAEALGHPEWAQDPRFIDLSTAMRNRHALRALLEARFAELDLATAHDVLHARGLNFSVVTRVAEVAHDPQLLANGLIVATDSKEPGYERTLATPITLHGERQRTPTRAPRLGEHSRSVLAQAGYSGEAIEALLRAGVIRA